MDVIALVISICAFIVSVLVPIFEFLWNNKMNKHNLEAEYFREMYGEIMYQKIPKALEDLCILKLQIRCFLMN